MANIVITATTNCIRIVADDQNQRIRLMTAFARKTVCSVCQSEDGTYLIMDMNGVHIEFNHSEVTTPSEADVGALLTAIETLIDA